MVIAIDGPAGGRQVHRRPCASPSALGLTYLDSGAMYRCVALAALRAGADPDDGEGVGGLAGALDIPLDGGAVLLDGEDVSDRDPRPRT